MSFKDFIYPDVLERLELTGVHKALFPKSRLASVRPYLAERLTLGVQMCAWAGNEKARSEFLVAPVLVELQGQFDDRVRVFSGVELSADSGDGLDGMCDFVFTAGMNRYVVTGPVLAVMAVEQSYTVAGFGRCIAGMRAAWLLNARNGQTVPAVCGVCTTGTQWKFLQLIRTEITIDPGDYNVTQPERLLGVMSCMVESIAV